jgi:hypothetical protein
LVSASIGIYSLPAMRNHTILLVIIAFRILGNEIYSNDSSSVDLKAEA